MCGHASATDTAALPFGNKTMLFVSGWPQSGTSLVQQILTVTPGMSTMVSKCRLVHGNKCDNWNNEGQWLAERSNEVSPYLQPGKMCPSVGDKLTPPLETVKSLSEQWARYWDLQQPILVEKSPQSMLKIPMLANMFRSAKALKFLVVLKHPVTLNVATPTDMGWLTNTRKHSEAAMKTKQVSRVSSAYSSSSSGAVEATFNTDDEIVDSVHFFLRFMSHNEMQESKYANGQSNLACSSLGWIPAMEHLVRQLRDMKKSHPQVEVRVVRFEHFQKPYVLCKAMNAFACGLRYADVVQWESISAADRARSTVDNVEAYWAYSLAVSTICDSHFRPLTARMTVRTSTADDQGRGTKTFRARKRPVTGHRLRRRFRRYMRRQLRGGLGMDADDGAAGAGADAAGDGGSVDVKVDDDDAEEQEETQAQKKKEDAGTVDQHGSAEEPLLPMKDAPGRLRSGRNKAHLGLLHAAHASGHEKRVKTATQRGKKHAKRLANARKAGKLRKAKRRNRKNGPKRRPSALAARARAEMGGEERRRLRLKEQDKAGKGLDFRPEIVSKTLRMRLAEFNDMFVRKAELLTRQAYMPHSTGAGGHIKSNISRDSLLFADSTKSKSLLHMLSDVDSQMRRFGYGLKQDHTPFFKESTELDEWDIMKQWRHRV